MVFLENIISFIYIMVFGPPKVNKLFTRPHFAEKVGLVVGMPSNSYDHLLQPLGR